MKQNRSLIKTYFETGDIPTQSQFGDSFDSQVFWNDDVVTTLGTTDDKVPTEKAVSDAISAIPTPTLQDVTTAGNSTTNGIDVASVQMIQGVEQTSLSSNGQIDVTPDTSSPLLKTTIQFAAPTGNNQYSIPDKGGATDTFAMLSDITGGGVSSVTGTCVDNTDPANPVVNALALDGSNANSDVDISSGGYIMNAASFHAKGTGGNGHYAMKHQSSGATASASESVIYADNSGNPQWKNDGSAVDAVVTSSLLGSIINALTGKTTPVDADMLPLADSAASNASKKVTWANVKDTLKTYFDTLYGNKTTIISNATAVTTSVGTAEQKLFAEQITASVNDNDVLYFYARATRTTAGSYCTIKAYLNTSNAVGGQVIGLYQGGASLTWQPLVRHLAVQNNTNLTRVFQNTNTAGAVTDVATSTIASSNITPDWTGTLWLIVTITHFVGTDVARLDAVSLTKL